MIRSFAWLVTLWGLSGLPCAPVLAQSTPITIVHVNDTHSWLDAYGEKLSRAAPTTGGIARAATTIAQIRASSTNVLALHAGDLMHGTEFFNGYFGVPELRLLTQLGFDAMAVGNHELDFGPQFLGMVLSQSGAVFPLLSANMDMTAFPTLQRWVRPSMIKELADEQSEKV